MITHFQFKETKGKDPFRKAWSFSFISEGTEYTGIYHQEGTIEWDQAITDERKATLTKELHTLMGFHIFR